MDLEDGVELIVKALEKREEDKAWQLYLTKYPQMDEKNYMSFEKFYNPQEQTDDRPVEEILDEVKETLNTFKGSWQEGR